MLRYKISLLERILAEKGKMQDHSTYHTSLTKSLGTIAQAELGIESDLVPGEHATAVQKKNNSDSKVNESEPVSKLSEVAAESLNPAVQGETTSSYIDVQAQPQHSPPHPDVALDSRSKGWQIRIEQLGKSILVQALGLFAYSLLLVEKSTMIMRVCL